MKLVFDEKALVDLESIYNWIAKDNAAAALAVVERLFASVEHLASFRTWDMRGAMKGRLNGSFRGCRILPFTKSMRIATKSS